MRQDVERYFNDLAGLENEVLDRKEEKELTEKVQTGDEEAKEKLVEHNLRLVVDVAKRYKNLGLAYADLIQAGNIGLLKAVDKFDPDRGNKFSTYAYWWIRQSILKALNKHSRTVRVPSYVNTLKRKIGRVTRDFKKKEGEEPTVQELAENLDSSEKKIKRAIKSGATARSLDKPLGEDEKGKTRAEAIEVDNEYSPQKRSRYELNRERLYELMNEKLSDKEKQVLKLRYGLEDHKSRTLKEVGRIFDLSPECIRQLQNRALDKLERGNLKRV